jgi:hypothetical protein
MRLRRWIAGSSAAAATCAVVAVGLLLVISPAAAAPSGASAAPCLAHGARYVVHHDGGDQVTNTYKVMEIRGVSCAFARTWVGRLTRKRAKHNALFAGVPGWYCGSAAPTGLVWRGACTKTGGYFSWRPKLPPPPPNAWVYAYDVSLVGSATRTFSANLGGGTVTSHWTQTVRGLRIRAARHTSLLPTKFRKAGWELFSIDGTASGNEAATIDYSQPPEGCSAHESGEFSVRALVAGGGIGTAGIVLLADEAPGCLQGPIDVVGGPLDDHGLRTGLAGLCWEITSANASLHFPNTHKRPRPWLPPMGQILKGLSWAKTIHSDETDGAGRTIATVQVTLTRRQG